MRNFVMSHPDYKKDSVVSDKITYDLTVLADQIVQGKHHGKAGRKIRALEMFMFRYDSTAETK